MQYAVGFDGGGSKTTAAAVDLLGNELFRVRGGAINLNGVSEQTVADNVTAMLQEISRMAGPNSTLVSVCIGAAGVSNPRTEIVLRDCLQAVHHTGQTLITGDHIAALAGAHEGGVGILLIAGTGSVCVGMDSSGQIARAGGRGHLIDDEGSGYAIGRDILSAVVRAQDGRESETCLTELVYNTLGVATVEELVAFVYNPARAKSELAALAKLLPEAYAQQDTAALRICAKAGGQLALLVKAVAGRLSMQRGDAAVSGSILLRDKAIRADFECALFGFCPHIRVTEPLRDAATGAALLALRLLQ